MRWDNLRDHDAAAANGDAGPDRRPGAAALPLFEMGAVRRSFDTPGFRGMTFYEVHARTIINQVPPASRMAFRWTVNPYRGCSHACRYCMIGETPILMADGRTRPLADLRPGDAVYGTVLRGRCRRYALTTVLAHWRTMRPAYLVTLADGTRLVASGDHRFLTDRGWKHVTGAERGPLQRPHLTRNNKLMGVGAFVEPPKESAGYRRGYLCGVIRGDGPISRPGDRRAGGSRDKPAQFRLALTDAEALDRSRDYLARAGIGRAESTFAEATSTHRRVTAIGCPGRGPVALMEWLASWPDSPSLEWRKGFLAGIFDAEGSYRHGILRICTTELALLDRIGICLRDLGFAFAVEHGSAERARPVTYIRLTGGLQEDLRFFLTTDPAITRKRSIEGTAIKSSAGLGVTSAEPLGLDLPMFDITTGTGDFIANGVVSHNCFARNTHTYLDLDAGRDFDSQVVVKVNAAELARKELAAPRWRGEHVAMGTNVDCYQRAEGRYRLMPGIITALREAANPFSILTKGTLILRDLDLLAEAAEVTEVGLNVSVGSTDPGLCRSVEPGTPSPQRRLEACAAITARGLRCGVLMGPVLPFLSDSPSQLDEAVRQIAAAGAAHVSPIVLHLRPGAREWYLRWLGEQHPELVPRYRGLYGTRAYAPRGYQQHITEQVRQLAERHGVGRASPARARSVPRAGRAPAAAGRPARPVASQAVQLSLL